LDDLPIFDVGELTAANGAVRAYGLDYRVGLVDTSTASLCFFGANRTTASTKITLA
jgi:hypothetical protein